MVEKWLERELASGLMGLVALRLDGAPAADAITMTLDVWLVALSKGSKREEHVDTPRIRKGFQTLFSTCERWPAPAALIRAMPVLEQPLQITKQKRTDAQVQTGNAALDQLMATMKRRANPDAALKSDEQIEDSRKQAMKAVAQVQGQATQQTNMEQS
ncbi:hypothetical protein [Pseudomonas sp. Irchel 3E13]|uniref:hypothetical protein n=1 Tax=Pseudomonas sp. Irchel 3E13 TaxID=2008975 RepID=UPI000BA333D1|nr:hypothetical protein [Pseudomonas sp. Irchel 3E13]